MTTLMNPQTRIQPPEALFNPLPMIAPGPDDLRRPVSLPFHPQPKAPTTEFLMNMLLDPYDPGCRYLRRVEVQLPEATGVFKTDYTYTAREKMDIGHFGAFEHVVCFNQIAFIMYARAFMDGYFKGVPPIDFTEYRQFQQIGMYILAIDNVRYVKAFPANEEFPGTLAITEYSYKPEKHLFVTKVHADFAEGKAVGDFTLALKRWDLCFADFDSAMKKDVPPA